MSLHYSLTKLMYLDASEEFLHLGCHPSVELQSGVLNNFTSLSKTTEVWMTILSYNTLLLCNVYVTGHISGCCIVGFTAVTEKIGYLHKLKFTLREVIIE